jgi:hypothetical protein
MVDYRKFLAGNQALALPWLGGDHVEGPGGRRWRLLRRPPAEGWYHFTVARRGAEWTGPSEPTDTSGLEVVRGWLCDGLLVQEGARVEPVHLLPGDEPPRFSPILARRWHSRELLFDCLEFETEAEGLVRLALAEGRGLTELKAVAAPLRAAFGFALVEAAARRLGLRASPHEIRARVAEVAAGGPDAAVAVLEALETERDAARRALAELDRRHREARLETELEGQRLDRTASRGDTIEIEIEIALSSAGAQLESSRRLAGDRVEVVFRFMGQRFVSVADARTLQIVDAGICLGHPPRDELLTLDSLPGVIQEAIETDQLVILRWP